MTTFAHSSPSSNSTEFDNNLTPIQAAAAIAIGFGLSITAVAAKFQVHRSTLHNWLKEPAFLLSAQSAKKEFETQFRTQLAVLTRLALNNIREILTNPDASPSIRLKAALAVLKQDWKLPESTEFDTISGESDSPRNEMAPEPPAAKPEPIRTQKVGRNEPCPCGSNLKYKHCCGNPVHQFDKSRHPVNFGA
jgi:transposase-like protein